VIPAQAVTLVPGLEYLANPLELVPVLRVAK